jgi:hypothetical protein
MTSQWFYRHDGKKFGAVQWPTILALGVVCWSAASASPQTPPATQPAKNTFVPEPLRPGWDQIDERLVFLTVRLSSVEASVDALDKALKSAGYSKSLRMEDAEHARNGNELMDRKGGGPVPWQDFYGRTAQDFYFHPGTVVQKHSISGSLWETDVHIEHADTPKPIDRPPQLDYIYRANSDNQKRAESAAAELGGKIDKLLERRRALESEQSALWSEIAFQAVASRDLDSNPLYRFQLKSTRPDATADQVACAEAACDFIRTIYQLMDDAQKGVEKNPGMVFHELSDGISTARKALSDRLAERETIGLDLGDKQSKISKVAAVAKRLDDLAKNMDESYRLAIEGDIAGDDQRKNTFRGILQDGLLSTADSLVTADQCVLDLVKDWKLSPDVKKPATEPSEHIEQPPGGETPNGSSNAVPHPATPADVGVANKTTVAVKSGDTADTKSIPFGEVTPENHGVLTFGDLSQCENLKLVASWQGIRVKTRLTGQNLTGSLVLTQEDSPYLVSGTFVISAGATLSIQAGTVVLLSPKAEIENHGTIKAVSDGDWIVIGNAIPTEWYGVPTTALINGQNAIPDPPDNWHGILSSGNIELHRCLVVGAVYAIETDNGSLSANECIFWGNGETLSFGNGGRGNVQSTLFFHNGVGPYGHGSDGTVRFTRCLLLSNKIGCTANSNGKCEGSNSTFYGNELAIAGSNKGNFVRIISSNILSTTGIPLASRGGKGMVAGNYWGDHVPADGKFDTRGPLSALVQDAMPNLPPCEYISLQSGRGPAVGNVNPPPSDNPFTDRTPKAVVSLQTPLGNAPNLGHGFGSLSEVMQTIPNELFSKRRPSDNDLQTMNDILHDNAEGQKATISFEFRDIRIEANKISTNISTKYMYVGPTLVHLHCLFDSCNFDDLSKINVGDKVVVEGEITSCSITKGVKADEFYIALGNCKFAHKN